MQSARSTTDARIQSSEDLDALQADLEAVGVDLLSRHTEMADCQQELSSRKVFVIFFLFIRVCHLKQHFTVGE